MTLNKADRCALMTPPGSLGGVFFPHLVCRPGWPVENVPCPGSPEMMPIRLAVLRAAETSLLRRLRNAKSGDESSKAKGDRDALFQEFLFATKPVAVEPPKREPTPEPQPAGSDGQQKLKTET